MAECMDAIYPGSASSVKRSMKSQELDQEPTKAGVPNPGCNIVWQSKKARLSTGKFHLLFTSWQAQL